MSSLIIEMAGQRFGRLLVLAPAGSWYEGRARRAAWRCVCDCGNGYTTTGAQLRERRVVSCGCWNHEQQRKRHLNQPRDDGGKWISGKGRAG
jgi:hypothetical protein